MRTWSHKTYKSYKTNKLRLHTHISHIFNRGQIILKFAKFQLPCNAKINSLNVCSQLLLNPVQPPRCRVVLTTNGMFYFAVTWIWYNFALYMDATDYHHRPTVAIIDACTPAALGMKALLQEVVPIMEADTFGSFAELAANRPEHYYHYFVSLNIMLENRGYFMEHRHKTIVLTPATSAESQPAGFHSICTSVPERQLAKSLMALEQSAHAHGHNLPPMPQRTRCTLSDREVEVMALIVRGLINKEIADRLNIGLATVITHRRNIMEKLGVKSVSALTIYAVMNGYVDIDNI